MANKQRSLNNSEQNVAGCMRASSSVESEWQWNWCCCSDRDELASRLATMNVHVQQLTAREADAYQQVKACIELAEQSQMDVSQVGRALPPSLYSTTLACCLIIMPSSFIAPPLSIPFLIFCSLLLFLFSFSHLLYLFSSIVHPIPFCQNRPTPFPGKRS